MRTTAIIVWVYALMMAVGGVFGYLKVHSKASLISGLGFGLILLYTGYEVWNGSRENLWASAIIAALLMVIFAIRLVKTRRFMPGGMLALLSMVTLVIFLNRLIKG
jgi:uncharacterized membrane protein (UPF0136 family)